MSWTTKAAAKKAGEALRKKLKGKGWKIRVWENIGWHLSAQLGRMTVHGVPGNWWTLLGKGSAGEIFWSPRCKGFQDPNAAVRHQLKIANAFLSKQTKHLRYIDAAITKATGRE